MKYVNSDIRNKNKSLSIQSRQHINGLWKKVYYLHSHSVVAGILVKAKSYSFE